MKVSVGAIIWHKKKFLLLKKTEEYWEFPKGKKKKDETDIQTMLREIEEETSIKNLEIVRDFQAEYLIDKTDKLVKLFLIKPITDKVVISREHKDYDWFSFEEALEKLKFENMQKVLIKAQNYLEK